MYLETVISCVNYTDYLAHTLPNNKNQFDDLIVVTDTKDKKTPELCEYHNVKCIQTDLYYQDGGSFNRGAAVNYAIQEFTKQNWVLHLDADIVLPPNTKEILDTIPLQKQKLYTIDRLMCPSYESWMRFVSVSQKRSGGILLESLVGFPMGIRIFGYDDLEPEWLPIGFFQLWNPNGSGIYDYPTESSSCSVSDILHSRKFSRENRELIPEIIGIHLDSEGLETNEIGRDWNGRKSKIFGPSKKSSLSYK